MATGNVIHTNACSLWLDEEGILRVNIRKGARVGIKESEEIFQAILDLTKGKKVLELMDGVHFFTLDEAAQKMAAKHGKHLFIASAIVSRSRAMRLMFNCFNMFFKQPVPFRMFSTEEKALEWLRTFKK